MEALDELSDSEMEEDWDDSDSDDQDDFEVTKAPQWTMNRTAPATPQRSTTHMTMETPAHDGVASGRSVGEAVLFEAVAAFEETALTSESADTRVISIAVR